MKRIIAVVLLVGCSYLPWHKKSSGAATSRVVIAPAYPEGRVGMRIQMSANVIIGERMVSCVPRWESLNPNVATISQDGVLDVHHAGSTTIRAFCGDVMAGTTGSFGP